MRKFWIFVVWRLPTILAFGQSTLNITNTSYGGVGDCSNVWVNCYTNEPYVGFTNGLSSADIGKVIELFNVGQQVSGLNSSGIQATNFQDLVATITNVIGTNAYLTVYPQVTTNTDAIYGTDNTPVFTNMIAACAGYTYGNIFIEPGNYLCMPQLTNGNSYAWNAIQIHRGGLSFLGMTNNPLATVLMSRGAWMNDTSNQEYSGTAFRGFLFEVVAPITNQYPWVLENLTLDGGLLPGNTSIHGIQVNPVDGKGWDQQHSAVLWYDAGSVSGSLINEIITNCVVQHWRGEMVKSIDQNTNGNILITGCQFLDGNASALNIFMSQTISNCVINNLYLAGEIGQQLYTNKSYFVDNFVSNITDNGWTWTVASPSTPPYVMESNTMWFNGYGMNGIQFSPGANISVIGNQIHCAGYETVFDVGTAGSQGSYSNVNLLISGNSIFADAVNSQYPTVSNILTSFVIFGGSGIESVTNLTISSNTVTCGTLDILIQSEGNPAPSGIAKDITFNNNVIVDSIGMFNMVNGFPMVLIQTNNSYTPPITSVAANTTNIISYSTGPIVWTYQAGTGAHFLLQDTNAIPTGACITFDNRTNISGSSFVVADQTLLQYTTVTTGNELTEYWNPTSQEWQLLPPLPPNWGNPMPFFASK